MLAGDAPGRQADSEITLFDSTGLAIQDLAIALAALERRRRARPADDRPLTPVSHVSQNRTALRRAPLGAAE